MSKRINRLDDWIDRMTKLLAGSSLEIRRESVKRNCRYGMGRFCDGRPNPCCKKEYAEGKIEPCEYFVGGKCTFEKIKENRRSNEK